MIKEKYLKGPVHYGRTGIKWVHVELSSNILMTGMVAQIKLFPPTHFLTGSYHTLLTTEQVNVSRIDSIFSVTPTILFSAVM